MTFSSNFPSTAWPIFVLLPQIKEQSWRRNLGQKVFSRPGAAAAKEEEAGWRDSLYRAYKSGQQSMRVAVYGCKHDAAMFEELLKEYCTFDPEAMLGAAMIDTACLNTPKVTEITRRHLHLHGTST